MTQTYGIEASHPAAATGPGDTLQPAARFLVLIDAAGIDGRLARMFLASLEQVAEFDATAPEVMSMVDGLVPERGALQPCWDRALAGHSQAERAGAEIFTLDV